MGYNERDISIVSDTDDGHKKLDDGVYVEKCDNTSCINHDSRGFCRYETCVLKADTLPKQHSTFMRVCAMCKQEKDFTNLRGDICRSCIDDLISITTATDRLLAKELSREMEE